MRTVVLGATVALAMGLTGVSGASATPMTAGAADEAAGAVSLVTKAVSSSTVPSHSAQYYHHHHHHYKHNPTVTRTPRNY